MDHDSFFVFRFKTEQEARAHLREMLRPYFVIYREVWCRHLISGNRLRIDYVARPLPLIDFPFAWFGLEVKTGVQGREYNLALKQCIDYTHCEITDDRPGLARIKGERIERVYLFPGLPDTFQYGPDGAVFSVNRLAGLFHVGLIYQRQDWHSGQVEPYFLCSSDRQWSPTMGSIRRPHNIRQRVGSGVLRVVK